MSETTEYQVGLYRLQAEAHCGMPGARAVLEHIEELEHQVEEIRYGIQNLYHLIHDGSGADPMEDA